MVSDTEIKTLENADFSNIAKQLVDKYQINSIKSIENTLQSMFKNIIETIFKCEMDDHLGYNKGSHEQKDNDNRRNGYITKTVNTSTGPLEIRTPRDRDSTFEPIIIPKRKRNVNDIEPVVLSMYAKGMSQRDIADEINVIYNYKISHESVSNMIDNIDVTVKEWQKRLLQSIYVITYVDCIYTTIRTDIDVKQHAVYVILGVGADGKKDILGFWISENESKHYWMKIFDELKVRGVKDIIYMCMDGLTGLEEGAKAIFPSIIVQRCMVHLSRNSMKYIPSKHLAKYASQQRMIYNAKNLEEAEEALENLKKNWGQYNGAIAVWENNWQHVAQLYNYTSDIRKILYTTNPLESVNSSL